MPTQTFFHLPEEKREKLLCAARAEFSRVSYAEASINKIVQAASISRGSFYLYFAGKEDLFHYLVLEYRDWLAERLTEQLCESGGDLFAAFLGGFDRICDLLQTRQENLVVRQMIELVRRNVGLQPDLLCSPDPRREVERLAALVDLEQLDLPQPEDLRDLFFLLLNITGPTLAALLGGGEPNALRRQYQNKLRLIQRGVGRSKGSSSGRTAEATKKILDLPPTGTGITGATLHATSHP